MKRNLLCSLLLILGFGASGCAAMSPISSEIFCRMGPVLYRNEHRRQSGRSGECRVAEGVRIHGSEFCDIYQRRSQATVKAARFADATGAYGSFLFYRTREVAPETIGDEAFSNGTRVVFYRANVLVHVTLDRVTPMSAGDLPSWRTFAIAWWKCPELPSTPHYLPPDGLKAIRNMWSAGGTIEDRHVAAR